MDEDEFKRHLEEILDYSPDPTNRMFVDVPPCKLFWKLLNEAEKKMDGFKVCILLRLAELWTVSVILGSIRGNKVSKEEIKSNYDRDWNQFKKIIRDFLVNNRRELYGDSL